MWLHKFTIEGDCHFPNDMLRYDSCFPSDDNAVSNMTYCDTIDDVINGTLPKRKVNLSHFDSVRDWTPTNRRWISFGWKVVKLEIPQKV